MDAAAPPRSLTWLACGLRRPLVLIPVWLAAVWFGPPWLAIVVGIAGAGDGLGVGPPRLGAAVRGPTTIMSWSTVALAVRRRGIDRFPLGLAIAVVGGAVAASDTVENGAGPLVGTLWVAASCAAFFGSRQKAGASHHHLVTGSGMGD